MRHTRLGYSTEQGRARDGAWSLAPVSRVPTDGVVRLFRERGGRGGKTVTVVRGLPERGERLQALAAHLKQLCGAGGTVKDGAIEIQGDHRQRIAAELRGRGRAVELAGG